MSHAWRGVEDRASATICRWVDCRGGGYAEAARILVFLSFESKWTLMLPRSGVTESAPSGVREPHWQRNQIHAGWRSYHGGRDIEG